MDYNHQVKTLELVKIEQKLKTPLPTCALYCCSSISIYSRDNYKIKNVIIGGVYINKFRSVLMSETCDWNGFLIDSGLIQTKSDNEHIIINNNS